MSFTELVALLQTKLGASIEVYREKGTRFKHSKAVLRTSDKYYYVKDDLVTYGHSWVTMSHTVMSDKDIEKLKSAPDFIENEVIPPEDAEELPIVQTKSDFLVATAIRLNQGIYRGSMANLGRYISVSYGSITNWISRKTGAVGKRRPHPQALRAFALVSFLHEKGLLEEALKYSKQYEKRYYTLPD